MVAAPMVRLTRATVAAIDKLDDPAPPKSALTTPNLVLAELERLKLEHLAALHEDFVRKENEQE